MRTMLAALLLFGVLGAGCDDKKGSLYIKPWSAPPGEILVGQTVTHPVVLSQAVADKMYVDVDNQYPDMVDIQPLSVTFKIDEYKKDVTIKGLKPTNGRISIRFTIRDTTESRELSFMVVGSLTPDSGPAPDRGPLAPDKGTPAPDKGPTADGPIAWPDTAPAPDITPAPDLSPSVDLL